jgi:glycosyltransferase involved in cell wall biosynthesis
MIYFVLLAAALWLLIAIAAGWNILAAPPLPPAADLPAAVDRPRVSVIVAARDEAARIEHTVRGLLDQQGVDLELIVVDDRSRDETPSILARLNSEDQRVQGVRVDELPSGWLGKCHACWLGGERATGEWILFTDGDIHMRPDVLARAVAVARREEVDHIALWPAVNSRGSLARASILAWGQFLALYCPAARINRDRGAKAVGIGAFNLVRSAAYRHMGGHQPLRMEVVDDIKLGLLLRRAGFRQRLYAGFADLEAEWAHTAYQVIKAVEKNWFAGLDYSISKTAVVLGALTAIWLLAAGGPLLDGRLGWLGWAGLAAPIGPAWLQARMLRWPVYVAWLAPLGFITFICAGCHSTWQTLRHGGVRWRDTFYPLVELRAALVK